MLAVYALTGHFTNAVLLGALIGFVMAMGNFLSLSITVSNAMNRAANGGSPQKAQLEIQTSSVVRPLVLALDGRCGSGKTTLANGLAAQFPGCTLLRTDDFYLPPAQRIPDWAHTPCANMDLTRLRDEALRLAYAGQTVAYRAYSCREGAFLPPAQLPAQPLVILEGSYSHHPLLRPYETLRVFVTCTKAEQTRRLQAREGARYADFAAQWIPLEEGYFAQYGIAENADFVVETTQVGTI